MNFVHKNRITDGDLKLQNVLITKTIDGTEVIKVTDFGCARVAFKDEDGVLKTKYAIGTITYMSPEQLRVYLTVNLKKPELAKRATYAYNPFKSDVWAVGVCLYHMFFKSNPFKYDAKREPHCIVYAIKILKDLTNHLPKDRA